MLKMLPIIVKSNVEVYIQNQISVPLYFGGEQITVSDLEYIEVRVDIPVLEEQSHNFWEAEVQITLLVNTKLSNDIHQHSRTIGTLLNILKNNLDLTDYSTGMNVGCLSSINRIETRPYGIYKEYQQTIVSNSYKLEFNVEDS